MSAYRRILRQTERPKTICLPAFSPEWDDMKTDGQGMANNERMHKENANKTYQRFFLAFAVSYFRIKSAVVSAWVPFGKSLP